MPEYGIAPGGVKFTENDAACPGCSVNGAVTPKGPVNPSPLTAMPGTVTACGFKFVSANVQLDEVPTITVPQLKGTLLEQPAPLVKVGAITPDPNRIVDSPPDVAVIVRLALKLATEVALSDTQKFSDCDASEFPGIGIGNWISGYSNENPAPPKFTPVTLTAAAPLLYNRNCTLEVPPIATCPN